MADINQQIARFCSHFSSHVETAERDVARLGEDNIYSRMIICTALDTLAKVSYPTVRGVGKRFLQMVRTEARWQDADRVSLLHLVRALQAEPSAFAAVLRWGRSELSSLLPEPDPKLAMHLTEGEVSISGDPLLQDAEAHWPRGSSGKPVKTSDGFLAEDLTHARLLYKYRNRLVHEMLVPGRGWDMGRLETPHYQIMATARPTLAALEKRWELVYPLAFLAETCRAAIDSLRTKLETEGRDPFETFTWGTYWIDTLN